MPKLKEEYFVRPEQLDWKFFEKYSLNKGQQKLQNVVNAVMGVTVTSFGVFDEPTGSRMLRSCFDLQSMAVNYMPLCESELGNTTQYYLWLLWRIQLGTSTFKQIFRDLDKCEVPRLLANSENREKIGRFWIAGGRRVENKTMYPECDIDWVRKPESRAQELRAFVVFKTRGFVDI